MAAQPFLLFPRPMVGGRAKLGGGGSKFRKPTAAQQLARLDTTFRQIAASFRDVQADVVGIEPEEVIVLETIATSVDDVARAASRIPGLEWLAERELEEVGPELGFESEEDPQARLPRRLYALFTNQGAMDALIRLWQRWAEDPAERAGRGFGPFKNLFT